MGARAALKVRLARGLPVVLAAIFLLSCLAVTAHLAMAEDQGCRASHPSVRSCEPTVSHDVGPILPGVFPALVPLPAPAQWITVNLGPWGPPPHPIAPSAPRSPPLLAA